jgi:hypothetical protein
MRHWPVDCPTQGRAHQWSRCDKVARMTKRELGLRSAPRSRWWQALLVLGVLGWMTGCAGEGAGGRRLVLYEGVASGGRSQPRSGFSLWSKPDDFQQVQQSAQLEEGECHAVGKALEPGGAQKLWQGLARTRTTLQNFAPRRTLAFVLSPVLFQKEEVPYEELLRRLEPFTFLVVMRPDGYLASAMTGKPLQRMGRLEVRDGRLMAGVFEVGGFYRDKGGVFYQVDSSLRVSGNMLGELGLEHDIFSSVLDGAEDAVGEVVLALAQLVTSPVRSLQGLQQLPTAVAALIASSPGYFEHYSALPLQQQVREAARLSTHLLMLYGSAAGSATRVGLAAAELPVLSLTAQGALALEQVAVPVGSTAAALGTGAGAIYVLMGAGKGAGGGFKAFTEDNFRDNLSRLTGQLPENAHAHHVFPQKLAVEFQKVGINVHDPRFGAWWEKSSHLKNAAAYTRLWERYMVESHTVDEIFKFGKQLAGEYEFEVHF